MNFFSTKILTKLRNRAYFQQLTVDGVVKSEGAWRITLLNFGDEDITITDGGGGVRIMPGVPAVAFSNRAFITPLIIGQNPEMITDDELTIKFAGGGTQPLLQVQYDRLIYKKEDSDYPQDRLLEEEL